MRDAAMRGRTVALIVLRVVLGVLFLAAGCLKLFGAPMMVKEFALFAPFGIGQWFRYGIGLIEIVGALLLIRRSTVAYGSILLAAVCAGACVAQLTIIHQDFVHAIVLAILLGWFGWMYQRSSIAA